MLSPAIQVHLSSGILCAVRCHAEVSVPQCFSFVFAFHCSTHKPPTAVDTSTLALQGTTTANWLREKFGKFFVPMCILTNFLAINLKKKRSFRVRSNAICHIK
jgi:hypothetical protein